MTLLEIEAEDFFVAGGTLRPGSPSYVKRPADDELFDLALAGEFCYVLTARQMGKSSLMIHTARRLKAEGVHSVILDLTKIGIDVSVEQWYLGLLTQLKRRLRLSVDLEEWWQNHASLGNVQRFTDFLRDVLLEEIEEQVVIFVDEIDTTLNLPFSDDFFAAIRFVYNARATHPAYERLTFVLLGVATPADLIKDRRRTPFNIGQGIDLNDFDRNDAAVLKAGLTASFPGEGEAIFERIIYWTHGHPYLTQKLCLSAIETGDGPWTDQKVDKLVEKLFLSKEARKETNLQFVQDSVENSSHRRKLLSLYQQIYTGQSVPEVERSIDQNRLKLFGLVRVEDNILRVRNEIYRRVFNLDWIKENTPVDWSRRLVIILTAVVILLIGLFGYFVYQQEQQQAEAEALIESFRNTTDPNLRITSLAGLIDTGNEDQARQLFFIELTPEERLDLFRQADPAEVGGEVTTAVQGLYVTLDNTERDNLLLEAMVEPLKNVDELRAGRLQVEIDQWLQGRSFYNQTEYEQAVGVYSAVINQNDQNPGTYFDRGLAHAAMGDAALALSDFEQVLRLDDSRKNRVQQVISGNPALYEAVIAEDGGSYPALVALVPSPTSTPTPTSTSTSTPTVTPSPTSPPTETPTPVEPVPEPTEPATLPPETPSDTPTPIPPSPTSTPTPTPKPATVVFVQSSGATHNLGIVSSSGELINANLHPRAAAPAWSPDGQEVAFYGEQGISELGGIYAQGNGIWIIDLSTLTPRLFFQIDHVRNIDWSLEGTKLAFEFGPPGVAAHSVVVVDVRDGQEISRFPGEQPTWSPDGGELVIKSCAPECGLWLVGFDGSGGRLLTNDSTDSYPNWSPAGDYLVYTSRGSIGDWEIYRLDLNTGEVLRLTEQPGTDTTPVFSPDGLEIYWRTDAFGGWQIRAMAVDGSNPRVVKEAVGPSDDWGRARPAVR